MSSFTTDAVGCAWSAFQLSSTVHASRSTTAIPRWGSFPLRSNAFLASAMSLACLSAAAAGVEMHPACQSSESLFRAIAANRPPVRMSAAIPARTFTVLSFLSNGPPPPDTRAIRSYPGRGSRVSADEPVDVGQPAGNRAGAGARIGRMTDTRSQTYHGVRVLDVALGQRIFGSQPASPAVVKLSGTRCGYANRSTPFANLSIVAGHLDAPVISGETTLFEEAHDGVRATAAVDHYCSDCLVSHRFSRRRGGVGRSRTTGQHLVAQTEPQRRPRGDRHRHPDALGPGNSAWRRRPDHGTADKPHPAHPAGARA